MKFINYKLLLLFLCIATSNTIEAQVRKIDGIPQNNRNYSAVKEKLTAFDVYQIDTEELVSFMGDKTNAKQYIEFNLQLGDKHNWNISLFENDIRSEDYKVTFGNSGESSYQAKTNNITYEGYESSKNEVRLTITENFISGFVEVNNLVYYIEPLGNFTKNNNSQNLFIVYTGSSVIPNTKEKCIFESIKEYNVSSINLENKSSTSDCLIARIALANDYQMYLEYSSNVQNVINQNFAVINAMGSKFDDEFDATVIFQLVEQYFSTSPLSDPWDSTIECIPLLDSFRNWTITSGFNNEFDFASLWTGRDLVQGPINAGGCTYPFGLVEDCPNSSRQMHVLENSSNLTLNTIRQTHEIGHNFIGNGHNSPSVNRIMDQNLGSNTNLEWSSNSVNLINNRIAVFENALSDTPCIFDCNCQEEITVSNTVTTSQNNQAFSQLNVRSRINNGASATYKAGETVILEPNFHARPGSTVSVSIGECTFSTRDSETKDRFTNREVENVDALEKVVSLYPNPVQDILHVESDTDMVSIEITNQIGVLKERRNTFLDSRKGVFDVSDYKTGIYFMVITFKDGSTLKKTMIKK